MRQKVVSSNANFRHEVLILHLITGLNVAGAETLLMSLVTGSDRRRFEHRVVSMIDIGPVGTRLLSEGFDVKSLGMRPGVISLSAVSRLVKILRRSRPHLLHCWMYHANLLGLVAGKIAGVKPILWSVHSCQDEELRDFHDLTGWVVAAGAWSSRFADGIVFNSRPSQDVHRGWHYDLSKSTLVPSGFDLARFKPDPAARQSVRAELGLDDQAILVGMMARWHPVKDHANLLRAAAQTVRSEPKVHFLLAGDGVVPENPALRRLIREGNLDGRVQLLGFRDDVPRLTAALDVACLSSRSESFASVVAEAMACEVPCVATDCGGTAEVVGDTGRIVPVRNSEALASALAELVRMGAAERRALGQKARQRIQERFPLDRFVGDFEDLYRRLLSAGCDPFRVGR